MSEKEEKQKFLIMHDVQNQLPLFSQKDWVSAEILAV